MDSSSADVSQTPFVKQLVAVDRPTRDAAVNSLKSFVSSRRTFTELEFLKIWKGLFYCVWLSDRPRTQQRLSMDLASLVEGMTEENVVTFLKAFWTTMIREWAGIDVLRLDKFLFLLRCYVAASLRYLHARNWRSELVGNFMDVLAEGPLHPTDVKVLDGIRYHLIDIYVDELEKICPIPEESADVPASTDQANTPPIDQLMAPFVNVSANGRTKVLRGRATELLRDDRLKKWNFSGVPKDEDSEAEDDGEIWGGLS